MAFWDGTINTDFLNAANWDTLAVPGGNDDVGLDSIGEPNDPILFAGQSAFIRSLFQSARFFTVQGTLSVNDAATLSGAGRLTIEAGGTVNVTNGMFVESGIASVLTNRGTLNGTLQMFGGVVDNRGVITGDVTISGGLLNLNTGTNLSDSATLTVNGGTVNVLSSENVGLLAGTGGAIAIGAPMS